MRMLFGNLMNSGWAFSVLSSSGYLVVIGNVRLRPAGLCIMIILNGSLTLGEKFGIRRSAVIH
jgi:hypothetical protein